MKDRSVWWGRPIQIRSSKAADNRYGLNVLQLRVMRFYLMETAREI